VGSASVTAVFERVRTQFNGQTAWGIAIDASQTSGSVNGSATDSSSFYNGGGFLVIGNNTGNNFGNLVRSLVAQNNTGVEGDNIGRVYISQTTIINNGLPCSGNVFTYGDNTVNNNGKDCIPAGTALKD
jgi:hypothetical protein